MTLSSSNLYTGTTTISGGTLALVSNGSINDTSGIVVAQGAMLQVTAGSGGQLPDAGNVTLSGGTPELPRQRLDESGRNNGSVAARPRPEHGHDQQRGDRHDLPLLRQPLGQHRRNSQFRRRFDQRPGPVPDEFARGSGGIIGGYAFYNNADFASLTAAGSAYTVGAYSNYATGNLGSITSSGTVNAKPSQRAEPFLRPR